MAGTHFGSMGPYNTMVTHYDHVMKDKGVLKWASTQKKFALLAEQRL